MFYYLTGKLEIRGANMCVLDCSGIGYKLTTSMLTSEALANKIGQTVKLYTYLAVREDGIELFGFGSNEERECFNLLTSVSGVGPKAAISILSLLSPDRLSLAICTEDVKSISKASGIGAKTAARIVLELRDKVSKNMMGTSAQQSAQTRSQPQTASKNNAALSEACEGLAVLGYDRNTILNVIKGIDIAGKDAGEIIRLVLKKMAN